MRTFWKVLTIILTVTYMSCVFLSISMYSWPDMSTSPRPAEGRIYPLNNHAHYIYMNEREHQLRGIIWWTLPIIAVILGAILHFIDPFGDRRKRRLYGRVPADFR